MATIIDLKIGEKSTIETVPVNLLPVKFIEMGISVGNEITLLGKIPFNGPLYLNVSGNHLAIRKDDAALITIKEL